MPRTRATVSATSSAEATSIVPTSPPVAGLWTSIRSGALPLAPFVAPFVPELVVSTVPLSTEAPFVETG